MAKVTLRDIARASGVSPQSASRILGGHVDRFRPETRQRVHEAARRLNYRPDLVGRTLVRGKSMTLGAVYQGLGSHLTVQRFQAFANAAGEAGYQTYLVTVGRGPGEEQRLLQAVEDLIARRVDGLMISRSMPLGNKARDHLSEAGLPIVYVGRAPVGHAARITFRYQTAANHLARHLAELGHRRGVFFASLGSGDFPGHRIRPLQHAFSEAGMQLDLAREQPRITRYDAALTEQQRVDAQQRGYDVVREYLAGGRTLPDVFCMNNDEAAVGALAALREAGRAVPGEVSVTGWDDVGAARFAQPPLTTVRGPREEAGKAAFAMLERLMREPSGAIEPVSFAYELVVRESTGPKQPCTNAPPARAH